MLLFKPDQLALMLYPDKYVFISAHNKVCIRLTVIFIKVNINMYIIKSKLTILGY